jgi:large subunit ribosomal protein L1
MSRHGKRYRALLQSYDPEKLYSLREAIEIVKGLGSAKFDETVDLSVRLGVDVRRADQIVRGSLSLPKGTGRSVRVAVFAAGEAATQAREAGADVVGADDLVKRVSEEGFLDFDVAISTPDMMAQVGRLGKVLGPRGLMPNPKTGTVTNDVAKAVEEFKSGRVEYRTDRTGNIHLPIGKCSFPASDLLENARAAIDELVRVKPAAAKGRYLRSISLSTTMSPGVSVDPNKVRVDEEELAKAS